MKLAVESLVDCWDEIMVVARAHWGETEAYRHGQGFAPQYERYISYELAGMLFQVTARDQGRMVGYATMYVCPSMHTGQVIATEDTFFLLPEYRKGRNALRLLRFVEEECRKRGVVEVGMTVKETNPAASRVLEFAGYSVVSQQYSKSLIGRADSPHPQPEVEMSS